MNTLSARRLTMIITLKCTLNCRLCCNSIPLYEKKEHASLDEILLDIDHIFTLFDTIKWFQFVGGEVFLHPELDKVLAHTLQYRKQFEQIVFMTNGTLLPNPEVMDIMKQNPLLFQVQISDYGVLSRKREELEKLLFKNGVNYTTKAYTGDIQHYGGWVDNTSYAYRGKTEEQLEQQFNNCWQIQMENWHVYKGQLHNCCLLYTSRCV